MGETAIQTSILQALARIGVWAFRVNSGRRGRVWLAPAGTPDICLPALGWLECKTEDGELSADQVAWHERAKREGVRVAVVRSWQEAVSTVVTWRNSSTSSRERSAHRSATSAEASSGVASGSESEQKRTRAAATLP